MSCGPGQGLQADIGKLIIIPLITSPVLIRVGGLAR